MPRARTTEGKWCVYLLECKGGSYYTGITNNLHARYQAHVQGRGAKYTRSRPPRRLIGSLPCPDRASASRLEWQIKQMTHSAKKAFVGTATLEKEEVNE